MVLSRSSPAEKPFTNYNAINSLVVVTYIYLEANSKMEEY